MRTGMALHLDDIIEMDDMLRIVAAGILPETRLGMGGNHFEALKMDILKAKVLETENSESKVSETKVLEKYFENFERISFLMKSYADFLTEDRDRIYQASVSLLEFDGRLIS